MCDPCRWNDHDGCQGWLGQRQLRCLCRTCLDVRLAEVAVATVPVATVPVATAELGVTDLTDRPTRPGRPKLVLIQGGAPAESPTIG